ncbi:4-hydroxythreonine-4-phosphate dehydrogenase PdxA [Vallitalea guaymasensis]|uniref:4-hydroxythreonine-4-phosphate dehydrogenase PdxA n=1 Tax=Vallitalea guaymasensis TaxID=1185412 RepID=UPI000DE1FE54|nr:4-hydroxythreonine-4-phosphate dehydrogenase PdxA [Vallitalea guaymasensis]
MKVKPIILTMGDPAGIGPEIILNCFKDKDVSQLPVIVFGDIKVLSLIKDGIGITGYKLNKVNAVEEAIYSSEILNVLDFDNIDMKKYKIGQLSSMCGHGAYEYIISAIQHVKDEKARAVTTAPINKEALHMAGHNFPGHTEIFATQCGTKDYAMHLYDEKLSIIHVSTHVSLEDAIRTLSKDRVKKVIELAYDNMKKILNREPRIAVAGINPHSSENGLFGNQEKNIIIPAIEEMNHLNVVGPIPPDTVFYRGIKGEFDIVVAMYHDQGHIPFKMYAFESGVNTSAGLSVLRTSVDHGTAFDIAGKGIANSISMVNAIKLADKLTN